MCGRYYSRYSKQQLAENLRTRVGFAISANYNVAPATCQPVVRFDSEGVPEAVVMRWGLVPYWSKDAKSAHSMINTKAETVATGPLDLRFGDLSSDLKRHGGRNVSIGSSRSPRHSLTINCHRSALFSRELPLKTGLKFMY